MKFKGVCNSKFKIVLVLFSILSYGRCFLNLPEGSPCVGIDGVNGTCVGLYRCKSAALNVVFAKSGYNNGPELPEVCSYRDDDEPVMCCTDCEIDDSETLREYYVPPGGHLTKNESTSISWNKCMNYFQTLPYPCRGQPFSSSTDYVRSLDEARGCHTIYNYTVHFGGGGRDAFRDEYPHMALLGFGEEEESAQWLCGGSVISEWFVLTAAHCTSAPSLGKISYAAMGILKRSDYKKYWKVHRIKRILVHPEYQSPSKYHDIALLETQTEINFGKSLLPACVGNAGYYDHYLEAPGWGRLGHNQPLADTLQVLSLRMFNESVCGQIFPEHRLLKRGYDHETQMCYGAAEYEKQTDTCEGDSGGPLGGTWHCLHYVMGITSYGKDCGILGSAGIYTRVSYYVPWIESIVWPN